MLFSASLSAALRSCHAENAAIQWLPAARHTMAAIGYYVCYCYVNWLRHARVCYHAIGWYAYQVAEKVANIAANRRCHWRYVISATYHRQRAAFEGASWLAGIGS